MPTPPAGALEAVLARKSRVTRRCEIYESDGITPWQPGMTPRMIAGSVSVDYSRDDRRNIDLTLDNADGLISHGPGKFWYDKVIKVFRGVKWENTQRLPKIFFWDYDTDIRYVRLLQTLGFKVDRWTGTTAPTVNDIFDYDILVMIRLPAFTAAQAALAAQAYSIGINVFTMSPCANAADIPLYTAVNSRSESTQGGTIAESTGAFGSPFDHVGDYVIKVGTFGGGNPYRIPTVVAAGAQAATSIVYNGNSGDQVGFGLLYGQNPTSQAKWVHYAVPLIDNSANQNDITVARYLRARNALLHSAFLWLYAYEKNKEWDCQIGEFVVVNITAPRSPRQIQVTGIDYKQRCADSEFDNATSFDTGQNVLSLIRAFAANAGITKFRMDDGANGTLKTDTSHAFDSASSRWDAMIAVASAANLEIYFDAEGYLVVRVFRDPSTSAPTLVLKTGDPDGNLVDWSESSDNSDMYNRIVVSGTSLDSEAVGNIFQGIAENHEPSSPTSIENLGYSRTYRYSSPFFTSNEQCIAYAQSLLRIHALENFQVSYTSMVFAWLEAGEIVEIDKGDTDPTEPTRFLNVSFTIPLTLDTMSGTAKRITIVG